MPLAARHFVMFARTFMEYSPIPRLTQTFSADLQKNSGFLTLKQILETRQVSLALIVKCCLKLKRLRFIKYVEN